jgi:SpoVK/Ycf46/Vps4 family AAA+-type ATPase
LAPRAADNISSISAILNMGDGIFGSVFDVRIIATTNAKAKDIDPAIIRNGRLSKKITLNPFSIEDANTVYQRLIGSTEKNLPIKLEHSNPLKPIDRPKISLADIYAMARDNGWSPKGEDYEYEEELDSSHQEDTNGFHYYNESVEIHIPDY